MTQEEKQLLLKDLCARLPYHPNGVELSLLYDPKNISIKGYDRGFVETLDDEIPIEKVRLYLRPLSSMTEEEKTELDKAYDTLLKNIENGMPGFNVDAEATAFDVDFYNSHHLDYRGLIEKGLVLEAPEGMYDRKRQRKTLHIEVCGGE